MAGINQPSQRSGFTTPSSTSFLPSFLLLVSRFVGKGSFRELWRLRHARACKRYRSRFVAIRTDQKTMKTKSALDAYHVGNSCYSKHSKSTGKSEPHVLPLHPNTPMKRDKRKRPHQSISYGHREPNQHESDMLTTFLSLRAALELCRSAFSQLPAAGYMHAHQFSASISLSG